MTKGFQFAIFMNLIFRSLVEFALFTGYNFSYNQTNYSMYLRVDNGNLAKV